MVSYAWLIIGKRHVAIFVSNNSYHTAASRTWPGNPIYLSLHPFQDILVDEL